MMDGGDLCEGTKWVVGIEWLIPYDSIAYSWTTQILPL